MDFFSREDAGLRLGQHLQEIHIQADLVLGLPRGGVVVAAKVAEILQCPLDLVVVRKIGHPRHREFAVGALAEGGVVVLDEAAIESTHVAQLELDEVIAEENKRLQEYQLKFRPNGAPDLLGKTVVPVPIWRTCPEPEIMLVTTKVSARLKMIVPLSKMR